MKLIVVAGSFDPLHAGHLEYFEEARKLGDSLVAVVASDETVARKHRVLLPQADRVRLVGALKPVDRALASSQFNSCSDVLKTLTPTPTFVVGPDYADFRALHEYEFCRRAGIEVVCLYHLCKRSSSQLLPELKWVNPPVLVGIIPVFYAFGRVGECLVGRKRSSGRLTLLGGFVEVGETLEQACRRELKEETNLELDFLRYIGSRTLTYEDGRRVVTAYFTCSTVGRWSPTEEIADCQWVSKVPDEPFTYDEDAQVLKEVLSCA